MSHLEDYVLDKVDHSNYLLRALAKLPSDYERVIVILYLLDYNQGEIAEVFHVTRQRIQQQIRRFKRLCGYSGGRKK